MFPYRKIINVRRLSPESTQDYVILQKGSMCGSQRNTANYRFFTFVSLHTYFDLCIRQVLKPYPVLKGINRCRLARKCTVINRYSCEYNCYSKPLYVHLVACIQFSIKSKTQRCALKTISVFALMSDYSYYTLYFDIKANKITKKLSSTFRKDTRA